MTNHLQIVNKALHALLISSFKEIEMANAFRPNFGRGEYLRYWPVTQDFIEANHDGETRRYTYEIDIYFDINLMTKPILEDKIAARIETLKQLLMENRTYQPSNVYKWHDAAIETIEILQPEGDEYQNIYYIHCELSMMRFNQWSS